jgi:lysophospholipase L1-like esterase
MVLGLLSQLKESGIKFIVVDFLGLSDQLEKTGEIKSLADINLLNYIQVEPFLSFSKEFIKQYPNPNDDFHFNQEGNHMVAERLLPIINRLMNG